MRIRALSLLPCALLATLASPDLWALPAFEAPLGDATSPENPTTPEKRAAPGGPATKDPDTKDSASDKDPANEAEPEDSSNGPPRNLTHRFQVGLEVGAGAGYSFLITYRDSTWCGDRDDGKNATFCTGMHPVFLDLGLSFGALDSLDVITEVRLGLMNDPTENRPIMLMPGLRLWVDANQPFKIGVAFQLVLDLTRQSSTQQSLYGPPVKGERLDLGGRAFVQFQYDFLRYVGIYAKIGATMTARRWIGVHLDGQIGVQTRFP